MEFLKDYVTLMIGVALDVFIWLPFLYGAYLAIKKGSGVRGRWLFVIVAPAVIFTLLAGVPIILISVFAPLAIFVIPVFAQVLQHIPWWGSLAYQFSQYWWLALIPAVLVYCILAILFVNALWKRWPRLFDALVSDLANESETSIATTAS